MEEGRHAVRSGEIVHIGEILSRGRAANAQSVRVLGELLEFDPATATATIEYKDARLAVDTTALAGAAFRAGELLQLIGEISVTDQGPPKLQARVVRHVSGLPLDVYDQAVRAKRQFDERLLNGVQRIP